MSFNDTARKTRRIFKDGVGMYRDLRTDNYPRGRAVQLALGLEPTETEVIAKAKELGRRGQAGTHRT